MLCDIALTLSKELGLLMDPQQCHEHTIDTIKYIIVFKIIQTALPGVTVNSFVPDSHSGFVSLDLHSSRYLTTRIYY